MRFRVNSARVSLNHRYARARASDSGRLRSNREQTIVHATRAMFQCDELQPNVRAPATQRMRANIRAVRRDIESGVCTPVGSASIYSVQYTACPREPVES